jgi:hypothetical protein
MLYTSSGLVALQTGHPKTAIVPNITESEKPFFTAKKFQRFCDE